MDHSTHHHQHPRKPSQTNLKVIMGFWKWFDDNQNDFGDKYENARLLEELDLWVTKLGPYAWEVGPGYTKRNRLVLSPGGRFDLLEQTREIVTYANEYKDWEIYYYKPPKEWDLKFYFNSTNGEKVYIDAFNWKFVLLQYEDGQFEILVKESGTNEVIGKNEKLMVAEIILEGILGEEIMIVSVCGVEVVEIFDEKYESKAIDANGLKEFFGNYFRQN